MSITDILGGEDGRLVLMVQIRTLRMEHGHNDG